MLLSSDMTLHPGAAEMLVTAADAPVMSAEDMSKKVRKPYTITKSRESWTEQEHDKFLEALQLFDRDWKKIEAFVGSKTVIQIRSHAQKYFLKVQKNGTGEHVPPPRPKRKSAQPYPQKAPKSAPATHQGATSMSLAEPAYPVAMQPCAIPSVSSGSAMPAWVHHMAPPGSVGFVNKGIPPTGIGPMGPVPPKDQSGIKVESSSIPSQKVTAMSQGSGEIVLRAMPDFTEIYSFLGSVFDPSANGHLDRMREMAPIDRETVLLLMRNLSINLSSSDFEEHKLFLSVYDMEPDDALPGAENDVKSLSGMPAASQPPLDGGDDTLVSGYCELRQVRESREVTDESNAGKANMVSQANKMQEHPLLCLPNEELRGSTAGVSEASNGNEQCLQLSHTPLFLQQSVCETPELVKFPSESEDNEPGPVVDPFEAAELDDSKGGAEIVDMWWS